MRDTSSKRNLRALILAPTRELALQVSSHLNTCLNPVTPPDMIVKEENNDGSQAAWRLRRKSKGEAKSQANDGKVGSLRYVKPKSPPLVSVAAIVGGMSAQKQRRILDRGVDVLVATPGRLWDIMQEVCPDRDLS